MGLFTIRQLPKGHPDALITVPDRPGFHEPPRRENPSQQLRLDYRPLRARGHRHALRALDMPLTPSQRETVYLESRSPRESYVDNDGQLIRTESRSPNNRENKQEKRLSVSLSRYSTSPRSPRSPRTPVIVQERSPRQLPLQEVRSAPLPIPEPVELPQPAPYPVFVRAPTGEFPPRQRYESEDEYSSTTTEDEAASDDADNIHCKSRRHTHCSRRAPPPVPEAPPIVVDRRSPHRRGHSGSQSQTHSPTVGWEHEHFDGSDGLSRDFDRPLSRSHSTRERSDRERSHSHRHHHHSHRRRRSHHRHYSHREDSREERSRDDRLAPDHHARPRARTGPSLSPSPRPNERRERSYTTTKEVTRSVSRDGGGRHERSKTVEEKEVKGMLEDPREVRKKQLVEEKEVFGDGGRRVKQYHYR